MPEEAGREEPVRLGPSRLAVDDLVAGRFTSIVPFEEPAGTLLPLARGPDGQADEQHPAA